MNHEANDQAYETLFEELERAPTEVEVTDYLDSQEDYYCFAGSDGYIPLERKE